MRGINLKLQGQFKFDLYRPDGTLIKSSDYIDNFITNSGVMYPYHFAFADCFRFLSVGVGTTANSITSSGGFTPTTGLASSLSQYSYIGSRVAFNSGKDGSYYAQPGNLGAGCGYINTPSGISLIRQWNLPDNTGGVFAGATTFHEFMVSPGRPYVTGLGGVKFCSCNESDSHATGKDCSSVADYYNWLSAKYLTTNHAQKFKICDATSAFARVLYDFNVEANSILTVTYRLNVIVDTGLHFTSMFFNRADANPNWNKNLNAYSSITQPGVMLINDGTSPNPIAPNGRQRFQHFDYSSSNTYSFDNEYGESFVPPMGAPLEPSNFFLLNDPGNQNISVYMSDDNLQFLVNSDGGAVNSGKYLPWNTGTTTGISTFSSGVMPFRNDNDAVLFSGNSYWSAKPNSFNIRTQSGNAPNTADITQNVSMNANTYTAPNASLPTFLFSVPSTGTRNASVLYTYSFQNYRGTSSLQARSFVAAYKDVTYSNTFGNGDTTNLVPFFDAVFSGVSGNLDNAFIPGIETGNNLVAGSTGAIITGYNLPDYNILASTTNSVYPIINTALSWSVPCPPGVNGC